MPTSPGSEALRRPLLRPRLILAVYLPLLALAAGWSAWRGSLDGWWGVPKSWPLDLAIGIGGGLLAVAVSAVLVDRVRAFGRLADAMAALIGPVRWPAVIVAALASGVAEEAFFRGAMQASWGLWPASVVFGVCHLPPDRRFLPWTGFALAAGVGLGALFAWRGGLLAPVAAHVTVNLINLRMLGQRAARRGAASVRVREG